MSSSWAKHENGLEETCVVETNVDSFLVVLAVLMVGYTNGSWARDLRVYLGFGLMTGFDEDLGQ